MGDSRIVLFLRKMSPERKNRYSLRQERHRGLSRTIYERGRGDVALKCSFIYLLLLARRGHRPKKLTKLCKTVKQTSVCKFFI